MVAGSSIVALATTLTAMSAGAIGLSYERDPVALNNLKPREVTVTVTICPADTLTPAAPPIYTTADLPPMETTPLSYTTSMTPSGGETGGNSGSAPVPVSSYTPLIPIPITPTTEATTATVVPPQSTSVGTETTGSGTGIQSSSMTSHVTHATTTRPVTATSATGSTSTTSTTVGAGHAVTANVGLVVLVAMAALV